MLKVNWQTRVVHSNKIGHVNQMWVTSVSPRVYIYIYIYYTLGFTHCMPIPWQFISLVPRLLVGRGLGMKLERLSMNEEKYV